MELRAEKYGLSFHIDVDIFRVYRKNINDTELIYLIHQCSTAKILQLAELEQPNGLLLLCQIC